MTVIYTTRFIKHPHAGCTKGPFIFIHPDYKDDRGLIEHEREHRAQWFCTLGLHSFLYKDQTDNDLNLGVKAQQLETVFPELVDNSGFGEAPEGEAPYKAVYQTDFSYATAVALQEAIAQIEALKTRLAATESALLTLQQQLG